MDRVPSRNFVFGINSFLFLKISHVCPIYGNEKGSHVKDLGLITPGGFPTLLKDPRSSPKKRRQLRNDGGRRSRVHGKKGMRGRKGISTSRDRVLVTDSRLSIILRVVLKLDVSPEVSGTRKST